MIYAAIFLAIAGVVLWAAYPAYMRRMGRSGLPHIPFQRLGQAAIVVALIFLIGSTITIVAPGEVAVPVLFGYAQPPLVEGFHLRNPFASVRALSVRTQESTYSDVLGEGEVADRADAIGAVSLENAAVRVEITILWHLIPAEASNVYRSIGTDYVRVIVRPVSRSAVRDCISQFRFELARTTQRPQVEACVEAQVGEEFLRRGLEVDGVQLREISATPELQQSIETKLQAQQDAQRAEFRQQQARIDAETKIIAAEAEAKANQLIAESLTPDLLQLRIVEALGDKAIIYLLGGQAPTPVIPLPTP